ncbi:MAG TPA: LPS-assembly protein LptD, partial [Bradyrhizobium sp.]|nr:LPS-assembly protein LptD [Bradyrhizobium sp.]
MAVVAALQTGLAALCGRRAVRRVGLRMTGLRETTLVVAAGLLLSAAFVLATPSTAFAQSFNYNPRPPKPVTVRPANDGQMLVQAAEVDYDYNNSRVSAVGNVQLFYNGTSVEADKVIYDQKTKRLHAEGNIRMTDVDGKI